MKTLTPLLLKRKSGIFVTILTVLLFNSGCSKDETLIAPTAKWTVVGQAENLAYKSTVENNLLYAVGQTIPSNKLSIKFGARPTTSAQLKLVDYFKTPLAADEMIIGIRQTTPQGEFFYLSTGTDNIRISPTVTTDVNTNTITNISLQFNNIKVGRHDVSFNLLDQTNTTGFISEK